MSEIMLHEKSIMSEIKDAQISMELINFSARMQVLESETNLSRRRLLKLYKELKGDSPPKGMLPFSAGWYMSWEQNIHSSIFYNIYRYLQRRWFPLVFLLSRLRYHALCVTCSPLIHTECC